MKLQEQSEICEDLAIRWLDEAVVLLNSLLIEHGVSGRNEREAILGKFFFHLSVQLDGASGGIEFQGRENGPVLAFMEEGHKPPRLHVSDSYDLHDYAHGQVYNVLEGEET